MLCCFPPKPPTETFGFAPCTRVSACPYGYTYYQLWDICAERNYSGYLQDGSTCEKGYYRQGNTCYPAPSCGGSASGGSWGTCSTPSYGNGVCQNTSQSCPGFYVSGYCPGPNNIQCCVNPRFTISGQVFLDTNRNGSKDIGENFYTAGVNLLLAKITSSTTTNTLTNGTNYDYIFTNNLPGSYYVNITLPPGYVNTTPVRQSANITNANRTINFGITPLYTITGNVFNDMNKSRIKDIISINNPVMEPNITSGIAISRSPASGTLAVNSAAGTYSITNLLAGTYTVSYTSALPGGFFMIAPLNGPPPQLRLTVGPTCPINISLSFGASCNNGNIVNANFAISDSIPWMQSYGLNVRIDEGFEDKIPVSPLYPPYASVADGSSDVVTPTPTSAPVLVASGTFAATSATGKTATGLTSGEQYRIHLTGTYTLATNLHYDAQWSDSGGSSNCYCIRSGNIRFNGVTGLRATPDTPNTLSTHPYDIYWTANATSLQMYVGDSNYSDNTGAINYAIYTVP